MKPFIGIIGFAGAGKSPTIGSLTGVCNSSFRGRIEDKVTGQNMLVIASSPQVRLMSAKDFEKAIREAAKDDDCRGVVCSVQPTNARKRITITELYEIVEKVGGFDSYAFVIDPAREPSTKKKETLISALVKESLQGLKVVLKNLDGRLFPFKNAQTIQKVTKING